MEISENLLNKIRKLIQFEEGAAKVGNMQEAANAASRIRDLLMKHNLDRNSISTDEPEAPIGYIILNTLHLTKPHEGFWVSLLADTIAHFNLCRVIHLMDQGKKGDIKTGHIRLLGTEENVMFVRVILEELVPRIREMAKNSWKNYRGVEKVKTYIRGYYLGCVNGIHKQLKDAQKEEESNAGLLQTTALQIVNLIKYENDRITEYQQNNFPIKPLKGVAKSGSKDGYIRGHVDGNSMDINGNKKLDPKNRMLNP